jgi:hypothetical protein
MNMCVVTEAKGLGPSQDVGQYQVKTFKVSNLGSLCEVYIGAFILGCYLGSDFGDCMDQNGALQPAWGMRMEQHRAKPAWEWEWSNTG